MKTDFTRSLDPYRARRGEIRLVEVPPLRYLMVDGHGDPDTSPGYATAVQVLYAFAYPLKFASKDQLGRDYVVPPLEGLWWAEDMAAFTTSRDKSAWEGPVLADLHLRHIPEHDLVMTGRHHEIYLSDPRRTAPAKLRTILRQPVRRR
jgi:hypothetical protein